MTQSATKTTIRGIILTGLVTINFWWNNFSFSSWFNVGLSLFLVGFSLVSFRRRLALFIFVLSMNLFLIGRPVIDIMTNFTGFQPMHYTIETAITANHMITVALLSMLAGQLIYEKWLLEPESRFTKAYPSAQQTNYIYWLVLVIGMISFLALGITIHEKIVFRQSHSYPSLYSDFTSQLPFVIRGFSAIIAATLILFVWGAPRKRIVFSAMGLYVGLNAYLMVTGVRADFTKAVIFLVFVLLQRYVLPYYRSKMLKRIVLTGVAVVVLFSGLFFYVDRNRMEYQRPDQFILPMQLVYDQNISYMTLNRGQELSEIELFQSKKYTFGPFSDQFGDARDLKPYTKAFVQEGDSLAADIAYHLYGDNAFKGYGLGSSFIMELYHDFGFIGLGVYSLFLGMLLASLSNISWRNLIVDAIKMRILLEIFYIPRAPATQFIVNLLVPQFYLPVLGSIVFGWLVAKFCVKDKTV